MLRELGAKVDLNAVRMLGLGSASYGLAAVALAAWILLGDAVVAEHLPVLAAAERRFALAARLANDLRSAPRESGGRSCNVLFLRGAPSVPAVRAWISRSLDEGQGLLEPLPRAAQEASVLLAQLARAIVALYAHGDFGEPLSGPAPFTAAA